MCMLSMVVDSFKQWPQPQPWSPTVPGTAPLPTIQIIPGKTAQPVTVTPDMVPLLREIIDKLDALDKRLGAPDCNPEKAENFRKALDALEALRPAGV